MTFYLTDTKEKKEITMKNWTGSGYTPDYFSHVEENFINTHDRDDEGNVLCTRAEYNVIAEYWTEEVRRMNKGIVGQDGDDYSEQMSEYEVFIFAD